MNRSKRCLVMIVEDDELILMSVREILQLEGYEVLTASNGQDALAKLRDMPRPCLILLDLFMPVMDGWEFLAELKHSRNQPDYVMSVPIVITSAAGDRAAETAKQVQGYIKKPIDLDLLLGLVGKYCEKKGF